MNPWALRGRVILIVIFSLLALSFLGERMVYHSVTGLTGLPTSLLTALVLADLCALVYRGHRGIRWLIAGYFILNSLGMPSGLSALVGPTMATLIALAQLVTGIGLALALCLTPGIPAFLRAQRERRRRSPAVTKAQQG